MDTRLSLFHSDISYSTYTLGMRGAIMETTS